MSDNYIIYDLLEVYSSNTYLSITFCYFSQVLLSIVYKNIVNTVIYVYILMYIIYFLTHCQLFS